MNQTKNMGLTWKQAKNKNKNILNLSKTQKTQNI